MFFKKKNLAPEVANQISRRILTIEDDPTQRMMIQKTLEKKGYTVLMADSGEKGLEVAFLQKPDLIILDVVMPGIHGEEVCKRLKSDARTKNIPILFLTSMDEPKDIIDHYDLGAEVHLTKPINPKELINQIEITFGLR